MGKKRKKKNNVKKLSLKNQLALNLSQLILDRLLEPFFKVIIRKQTASI